MSVLPTVAESGVNPAELDWNDLRLILAICRTGSLSGAARVMAQNHSTIFRKINAIEQKTGVRFFDRLADGYNMTDAGATVLRYAERIETEVHALSREILGQDMRLQGRIRLTAPDGMATQLLPRLLAQFCHQHPQVAIEISGGSLAMDLNRREADVAIRATSSPPDSSLGRRVCAFRFAVYAAPEYLKRSGERPLSEYNWCFIHGTVDWLVPLIWKKKRQAQQQGIFSSNASVAVLNAAAEGLGLTMLPCYLGDADARLVRLGEPLETLTLELWILTHPDLRHTARVKALMAYLYSVLKSDEDLFAGRRPQAGRQSQ